MISQTTEYALRAVVWLAQHKEAPQTRHQIAEATQTPPDYLAKVMRALGRAGLVKAGRGLHGGFKLARPAESITILDVVNVVDPVQRIRKCPLGLAQHSEQLCPVHQRLDRAAELIEITFRDSSLAEMAGQCEEACAS